MIFFEVNKYNLSYFILNNAILKLKSSKVQLGNYRQYFLSFLIAK